MGAAVTVRSAMTTPIDPDLVARAADGERDATGELLGLVHPGVVRYCRARLGQVGGAYTTADDVAQEVCLALLDALPTYRDIGRPFVAFVYGIAAHKVADAKRSAHRVAAPAAASGSVEEELVDEPDTITPGPEEAVESIDLARRLSELLDRLPEPQREIVLLRVAVGLSADEVGSVVGMSAAAVRVAQSRALARLRALASDVLGEVVA